MTHPDLDTALRILRKVEFRSVPMDDIWRYCPDCDSEEEKGHAPDCDLADLLKRHQPRVEGVMRCYSETARRSQPSQEAKR